MLLRILTCFAIVSLLMSCKGVQNQPIDTKEVKLLKLINSLISLKYDDYRLGVYEDGSTLRPDFYHRDMDSVKSKMLYKYLNSNTPSYLKRVDEISLDMLDTLKAKSKLDTNTMNDIKKKIEKGEVCIIKWTKLPFVAISNTEFSSRVKFNFEKEDPAVTLFKAFGVTSYLRIFNPTVSSDGNRILITIEEWCGSECGNGETLFAEYIDGQWRIREHFFHYVA